MREDGWTLPHRYNITVRVNQFKTINVYNNEVITNYYTKYCNRCKK